MQPLLFVTTNRDKFHKTQVNVLPYSIQLEQAVLELEELQTSDGEVIARSKAEQAFEHFQQPVLVNDDSWEIPSLRGFPGANMKQCNEFLLAADWLRLMQGISDRRIYLISHYAYHNGSTIQTVALKNEYYFLTEPQGTHHKSPVLEVIAKQDGEVSVAKVISQGRTADDTKASQWQALVDVITGKV